MVKLTSSQRVVHALYFEQRLREEEVASTLKKSRPAVSMILTRIRRRYRSAGKNPPSTPGRGAVSVLCGSYSSFATYI